MIAAWWRLAAIVLAVLLLTTGAVCGTGWWLAVGERDDVQDKLTAERNVSAQLRDGIGAQNTAIMKLGQERAEAEARGAAAQQQAVVAGRRFDAALQRMDSARVTTCVDAMPFVNKLLEDVR